MGVSLNFTETPLRVLLVEDSPEDEALLRLEFDRRHWQYHCHRVETRAKLEWALDHQSWDVLLVDYHLPGFGAMAALEVMQSRRLDTPFIVVSGSIDDKTAIDLMEAGAHDYLTKGNLSRLAPVVLREVREARIRAERRQALAEVQQLAYLDGATGLPNQNRILEELEGAIAAGMTFTLAFITVEQYRDLRYGYGYPVGNQLLLGVARRLRGLLPEHTLLARLGRYDELAIFYRDRPLDWVQQHSIPRLLQGFEEPIQLVSLRSLVSLVVGLTDSSLGWQSPEACLRAAEMANYQAQKGLLHQGVAVYTPPMQTQAQTRSQMETDLRQAIREEQLQVYYQPIISLWKGQLVGFEALLRWPHPLQGWISPNDFVPLAESTGLIFPLGNWVFEKALAQLVQWQPLLDERFPLSIAVNLSAKQLVQGECTKHLLERYHDTPLHPWATLTLEITEGILLHDINRAIACLEDCRAGGFRISLDDFGTGYSSLAYLHRLPVDTVKIDRTFVSQLPQPEGTPCIVSTIQTLAQAMGFKVVAEGVETPEQLENLRHLGCAYGQGYLFAKPLGAEAATAFLTTAIRQWRQSSLGWLARGQGSSEGCA